MAIKRKYTNAERHIAVIKFWISNLKVARARWLTIPPANVYPDLSGWNAAKHPVDYVPTCGSVACFGGWVALMPEFNALGVYPDTGNGAPLIDFTGPNGEDVHPLLLCLHNYYGEATAIFGRRDIFAMVSMLEVATYGDRPGSTHRIVLARIDKTLRMHRKHIAHLKKRPCDYDSDIVRFAQSVNFPEHFA